MGDEEEDIYEGKPQFIDINDLEATVIRMLRRQGIDVPLPPSIALDVIHQEARRAQGMGPSFLSSDAPIIHLSDCIHPGTSQSWVPHFLQPSGDAMRQEVRPQQPRFADANTQTDWLDIELWGSLLYPAASTSTTHQEARFIPPNVDRISENYSGYIYTEASESGMPSDEDDDFEYPNMEDPFIYPDEEAMQYIEGPRIIQSSRVRMHPVRSFINPEPPRVRIHYPRFNPRPESASGSGSQNNFRSDSTRPNTSEARFVYPDVQSQIAYANVSGSNSRPEVRSVDSHEDSDDGSEEEDNSDEDDESSEEDHNDENLQCVPLPEDSSMEDSQDDIWELRQEYVQAPPQEVQRESTQEDSLDESQDAWDNDQLLDQQMGIPLDHPIPVRGEPQDNMQEEPEDDLLMPEEEPQVLPQANPQDDPHDMFGLLPEFERLLNWRPRDFPHRHRHRTPCRHRRRHQQNAPACARFRALLLAALRDPSRPPCQTRSVA